MSQNIPGHINTRVFQTLLQLTAVLLGLSSASMSAMAGPAPKDRHYNAVGFFDIHVCNWPNQPPFLMPLLSSAHYDDIMNVDILYPNG